MHAIRRAVPSFASLSALVASTATIFSLAGCGGNGSPVTTLALPTTLANRQEIVIPAGRTLNEIVAVTDTGAVLGMFGTSSSPVAFVWQNGTITELGTPGSSILPFGMNAAGQIVGSRIVDTHAVIWENGAEKTTLALPPGQTQSVGYAINASGQVAGMTMGPDNIQHPVLWTNGTPVILPSLPGMVSGIARAISDNGIVVGQANLTGNVAHAVKWENGQAIDLGVLPGTMNSVAGGVNSQGVIAGYSVNTATGVYLPFVWSNGVMRSLGALPGTTAALPQVGIAGGVTQEGLIAGNQGFYEETVGGTPFTDAHAFLSNGTTLLDLNSIRPAGDDWVIIGIEAMSPRGLLALRERKGTQIRQVFVQPQ